MSQFFFRDYIITKPPESALKRNNQTVRSVRYFILYVICFEGSVYIYLTSATGTGTISMVYGPETH